MKKITAIAGATGTRLRDRSRSVKLRVLEIARVASCGCIELAAAVVVPYRILERQINAFDAVDLYDCA